MKLCTVLLVNALFGASIFAAANPFVGTWVFNADKSPKPTIRYAIRDLGDNRYALTGSTGQTTAIKADGISIPSPFGGSVSFKKLDSHNWQMIRKDTESMVRTYTVSEDDKTLTLNDVFARPDGKEEKTVTAYTRLASGKSIFGEWQSVSMKEESSAPARELTIEALGEKGLTFKSSSMGRRFDLHFDGKSYPENGPGIAAGSTISCKLINGRLLHSQSYINEKPDDKQDWEVSADGKTMTITVRPAESSAVFISVFERR